MTLKPFASDGGLRHLQSVKGQGGINTPKVVSADCLLYD